MIRPIVKIVINGFTINSKTTWDDIHKISKEWNQLWKAMTLYQNSAYPAFFKKEMTEYEGEQDIKLTISQHNKFKLEKINHPEWFD